jgi:DNA-entry nuclease
MARKRKSKSKKNNNIGLVIIVFLIFGVISYWGENREEEVEEGYYVDAPSYDLEDIPDYSDSSYVIINNNEPDFDTDDYTTNSFEEYSDLDSLGRAGVAFANVGVDIMPTEERGSIGQVKPTGWHTVKYDIVDGKYLYNRCHLIGYQLTGENANEKNLITCTRYMNTVGMLEFENKVANYVKQTNNHVLYRVTPIYEGDNLLASGVLMEAKSVEDDGEGIKFYVYVYNVQEGITIDYATGDSQLDE